MKAEREILKEISALEAEMTVLMAEAQDNYKIPYAEKTEAQRTWSGEASVAKCRALQRRLNALNWVLEPAE